MRAEHVTRIADHSRIVHLAKSVAVMMRAAWRSSQMSRRAGAVRAAVVATPAPLQWRWCAVAIAVAAAGHLALRSVMPATVVPALPAPLLIGVAIIAAAVASQPSAFECAWRSSRLGVLLRGGRFLR